MGKLSEELLEAIWDWEQEKNMKCSGEIKRVTRILIHPKYFKILACEQYPHGTPCIELDSSGWLFSGIPLIKTIDIDKWKLG